MQYSIRRIPQLDSHFEKYYHNDYRKRTYLSSLWQREMNNFEKQFENNYITYLICYSLLNFAQEPEPLYLNTERLGQ